MGCKSLWQAKTEYLTKKMRLLQISLIIIKLIEAECPFKEISNKNNSRLTITNFNNFSELSFNYCKEPIIIASWIIRPNKKLILDDSLNFKGLTLFSSEKLEDIQLNNLKGFDLLSNPFSRISFSRDSSLENVLWSIDESNFNFYINNKLLNEQECLSNKNKNWNNLITNSKLSFLTLNSGTIYSLKTCPYIFKNTKIITLSLNEIRSSFVDSNLLSFLKLENYSNNNFLNSDIFHADFTLYRVHFDDSLLNEAIFKETKCLDLNGILNGIQNDLFRSFNEMKLLRIRTQHVKQLFAINNKWLEYLNFKMPPIDPDDAEILEKFLDKAIFLIIYQSFSRITFYNYPNEDFCLFMKFPHNKLVFPQLRPSISENCSCTEIYLLQYSFVFRHGFDHYSSQTTFSYQMLPYYLNEITDKSFTKCVKNTRELNYLIFNCNFDKRKEKCKIKSIPREDQSSYFEMYDWEQVRILSNLIFSVYLNNILSLIVILLNILTIFVIQSKSVVKEKNPMYNFLLINTILCLIYVTICLFKIVGICVYTNFYCSPLIETKFNIYYKVIFVLFIGESIKTAFYFSFISFSLSRYIKVKSLKSGCLVKLNKFRKRYYFIISMIISVFINLFHLFEYNFNLAKKGDSFFEINSFESFFKDSNPSDEFIENFPLFQFYLLNFFFYIKVIFSDLFYIIFNLIIDLKLLSFIKTQIAKKSRILAQIENNISNKANSTKNRITTMIILNGLNCLVLRFPSAFANFYGFIFRYDKTDKIFKPNISGYIVCRGFKICPSLQEILFFFYLISLLIQFLIFLKFDKIFRKGYNEIKENILKIFKKPQSLNALIV